MQENLLPEGAETLVIESTATLVPDDRSPLLRTSSYKEAVVNCDRGFFPRVPIEYVRAGLQANIRLFVTNSSYVFFAQTGQDLLQKQVCIIPKTIQSNKVII